MSDAPIGPTAARAPAPTSAGPASSGGVPIEHVAAIVKASIKGALDAQRMVVVRELSAHPLIVNACVAVAAFALGLTLGHIHF